MTHTPGRLYQGIERDGFGMRMLASMGWEEGTGIGKNGTGIVKHLHAKKRQLNSGTGPTRGAMRVERSTGRFTQCPLKVF